jgi:alkylation response protein AidB-like acyl-CoA dehydrogenase
MNFGFSDEQEMLRASARRFLETECETRFVRRMMADDTAHDPRFWKQLTELGWTGLMIPEEHGGQGGSFLDLIVVLEETGRALMPGPFFAGVVGGLTALLEGGSSPQHAELLPRVARGELLTTLAVAEADGRFDASGVQLRASRAGSDGSYVLSGEKHFVHDAHVADLLVVAARSGGSGDGGITLCMVDAHAPGVRVTPLRTVDMTRRICRVGFDQVRVPPGRVLGAPGEGSRLLERAVWLSVTGLVAEMVGTAQQALDRAVAYAKERVQFGRPIGSFQAIKHKCVDMMVAVENARSLAYYAAWAVAEHAREAPQAVAMAKAYASDMVQQVTSEAIQVHGGIGFTWEHDMHLFHRRAVAQEAAFGSAPAHRDAVARALLA